MGSFRQATIDPKLFCDHDGEDSQSGHAIFHLTK